MGILWIIIVGFIAGLIARYLSPGPNKPVGFLLTTALGIAGAFAATFVGQAVGWYRVDQGAGLIAATLGPSPCCSFGTALSSTTQSAIREIHASSRAPARELSGISAKHVKQLSQRCNAADDRSFPLDAGGAGPGDSSLRLHLDADENSCQLRIAT